MPKLKNPKAKGNKFEHEVARRINEGVGRDIAAVVKHLGADVRVEVGQEIVWLECKSPSKTLEKAFEQAEAFIEKEGGIAAAARRKCLGSPVIQVMTRVNAFLHTLKLIDAPEHCTRMPMTITLDDFITCLQEAIR